MHDKLTAVNWNRAYQRGKYERETAVSFVNDIIRTIGERGLKDKLGFYPGCGNGRNFVPLLDARLNIEGSDISPAAIEQLQARRAVRLTSQLHPHANRGKPRSHRKLTRRRLHDHVPQRRKVRSGDSLLQRGRNPSVDHTALRDCHAATRGFHATCRRHTLGTILQKPRLPRRKRDAGQTPPNIGKRVVSPGEGKQIYDRQTEQANEQNERQTVGVMSAIPQCLGEQ